MDRLIGALELISFASHGCVTRHDFEDVPEKWQELMRRELRKLGEIAEEALSNKESDNADI